MTRLVFEGILQEDSNNNSLKITHFTRVSWNCNSRDTLESCPHSESTCRIRRCNRDPSTTCTTVCWTHSLAGRWDWETRNPATYKSPDRPSGRPESDTSPPVAAPVPPPSSPHRTWKHASAQSPAERHPSWGPGSHVALVGGSCWNCPRADSRECRAGCPDSMPGTCTVCVCRREWALEPIQINVPRQSDGTGRTGALRRTGIPRHSRLEYHVASLGSLSGADPRISRTKRHCSTNLELI